VRDADSAGANSNSLGTLDVAASRAYKLTTCSGASLAAAPASPAGVGTSVTFTATAAGCPNPSPLYQFWVLAPGGSWTIVQPYSTSNSFTWSTVGDRPGATYYVAVWVRDADSAGADSSSLGTLDVSASRAYRLTTCSGASLASAPAPPAAVGTSVTFTATASGCPNASPLYQFWVLAPGGSWTIAQPYSTSNTFTWSTAGKPTGTYYVAVWVRDADSAGAYSSSLGTLDVASSIQYTLR